MKKIYLLILFFSTSLCIYFSLTLKSIWLNILAIILSFLVLGCFLKTCIKFFPKKIRNFLINIHVFLFEVMGLLLVYLLSVLSFYKKPFNLHLKKTPILFVHGYVNFSSVWIYHLFRLKKIGYGPLFLINLGYPFSDIDTYAKKLKKQIEKIQKKLNKKEIILIGHSMGGLISSYYASNYPNHASIKAIITLGSPLKGTKIAKIGIGKCCRQMEIESEFLQKLKTKYPVNLMYHIVTKKDQLVIPYTSGIINQERKYIIDDLGHTGLLYSSRVTKKIDYWLKKI
jgi:triacylglycerol esterase/lipase EstA (alpha/beta hydrolase family)